MRPRVVLVTGVSRYLGGRIAALLQADPEIERVVGVDTVPPKGDLGRMEFLRADIRNPLIAKVLAAASVDTVVHMNVIATPLGAGGRSTMKEINVVGTMQLLAACQKAPSMSRLVVKSTTSVYGSSPRDPAPFPEGTRPREPPRTGYAKDAVEVEGYVRGFGRRRPDVTLTVLRFTNFLGPRIETPLTRYFSLPVVPAVLGYDPGGAGVLLLSQAARRAGRPSVPVPSPAVALVGRVFRRAGLVDYSVEQLHFLEHGRAVDIRRLREQFGYSPAYTTMSAFDDFVRGRGLHKVINPDVEKRTEQRLLGPFHNVRVCLLYTSPS